jgi:hypothetical protein
MAYGNYNTGGYTLGAQQQPASTPDTTSKFNTMFEKALQDLMKKQVTPRDETQKDSGGRFMFGPQMRAGE